MTENNLKSTIEELKAEISKKNKEIDEYLDKIEHLEETIMEIEFSLLDDSDKKEDSLSKFYLKDIEKENRELKNKVGFLRLENVKLKQELEQIKSNQILDIQVVGDSSNSDELINIVEKEPKIEKDTRSHDAEFKDINIKCPKCGTLKKLKIPLKVLNQTSQKITTISIPKGKICEHSFQALVDKSLDIKSYQILDFELSNLEYSTRTTSSSFFQNLIDLLRSSIDDLDILGTAIFTNKGKLIYASVPSNILFNVIEEFEVRKQKKLQIPIKMFLELKDYQKIYSETIEIHKNEFNIVLILSKKVNFGMGTMLFKNLKERLKIINHNL
ncbi:MAG: hypothetical protein ACFFE4_09630 [Candidatus Thorarchaeota archaeon]